MSKVVIARFPDWPSHEGLYVDGRLVYESESISLEAFLQYSGFNIPVAIQIVQNDDFDDPPKSITKLQLDDLL